jgi:hypothetical protein
MAGLEPARAFYGPTDFKSVASAISPHRRRVPGSLTVYPRVENEFSSSSLWRLNFESRPRRGSEEIQKSSLPE